MPRKRQYKKRYKGYHPYVKASAPAVGYIAAMAAKKVAKKYLNVEYKRSEESNPDASFTNTGLMILLNGIEQGDGQAQRDGVSIGLKGISVKAVLNGNFATFQTNVNRTILFFDKQPRGNAPSASTILADTSNFINSPYNINEDRKKRFQFLYDKVHVITANKGAQPIKIYKRFAKEERFIGTGDTIASIGENSLYLFVITANTSAFPSISYSTRVTYVDN